MTTPQNEPKRADDTVAAMVGSYFGHAEHPAPFTHRCSKTWTRWLVLDAHNDFVCDCGADKESAKVIAAALNALAANARIDGQKEAK